MKELSNAEILRLIGARLKQYRLNLNVTQKEMAEQCGISLPTVQKMEAGTSRNISFSILLKVMRYLGIIENIDRLVPEQPASPYAKEQRQRIRHADIK